MGKFLKLLPLKLHHFRKFQSYIKIFFKIINYIELGSENMITCSVCGALNDPNNAVCEYCGSDLIDEYEAIMLYDDDYKDE